MASNTLFVSNFPFTTTEDELRGAFEGIGAIRSVRIIVDRETGKSRGFAFVELAEPEAADVAIEQLNETEFRGRRLVVSKAKGRSVEGGASAGATRAAHDASSAPPSPFRHRIVIDWSDDDNAYTASVPDLGVSVHAATIESALRQVQSRAREDAHAGGR
jgi:RNA recognition motif-containing protein